MPLPRRKHQTYACRPVVHASAGGRDFSPASAPAIPQTPAEVAHEILFTAFPEEFVEQRLGMAPDPKQVQGLDPTVRRGILNCCRQWGKSTTTAALAVHKAIFFPKSLILVVAPSEK